MYTELKSPLALESEVLAWWKEHRVFERGLQMRADAPDWVFYEGPPTANGMPHNGHVLTRVIKDLFPRYKQMRGYRVRRKAGWDTHGLPVEVEVEKSLGIHGREAIVEYGLEPFARKCIDSVFTYTDPWAELTERIGFWVDLDEAYVTYHRAYVESVWWALSRLFEKGLLYKGHKVVWWWPQGGTTLSAAEVGLGYKEVDDPSVTVAFEIEGRERSYLLAWTTTPWTLPSNTAIAVNPKLEYSCCRVEDGSVLIVAEGLREKVFDKVEHEVVETVPGEALVGLRYKPLYDFAPPEGGDAWRVITADHVTLAAGTGLVHTAPAFGEDDHKAAQQHGIGLLQMVGPDGRFVKGTGFLEGQFCKDADREILRDLKERGVLFKRETYRHDYPFCWRADNDPLIQYARPTWFIKTTALNQEALDNNAAVNWLPDHIKEGRFGDFLRNNVDWALSRERFWGTPLNIWECGSCEARVAPSSVADLKARGASGFDESVDEHLAVHRPWVDKVTLPCSCGGTMTRVTEVIDCWFDSGCMPFAQWGFPHANQDDFRSQFPADFISEAVDQTRGWFYSLLMISTLLFDDETCREYGLEPVGFPRPYKTCIVLGHVCDMDGKKESKSKGNYTSPDLVIKGEMTLKALADDSVEPGTVGFMEAQVKSLGFSARERFTATGPGGERVLSVAVADVQAKETVHLNPADLEALGCGDTVRLVAPFDAPGADAFRWLFYASNPPWSNTRLSLKNIREGQREFQIRLRNVHSFFAIYANIVGFDPATTPAGEPSGLDRWVLGELDKLTASMTRRMDDYALYEAARELLAFVDGLSNWYVRRSRRRFWGDDPQAALHTLYRCLLRLSKLIAPFVPFMAEALYRDLRTEDMPQSVHLCDWPAAEGSVDEALSSDMELVRELASLGLAARKQVGVRVRQPLRAVEVVLADEGRTEGVQALAALLAEELNVREVHFSQDAERFVDFKVKPNFAVLGRKLGKDMKACAGALARMPGAQVRARVLGEGLTLELPSQTVTLGPEEVVVQVEAREGFQAAGSARAVVVLHADLDDSLREEGLSRELISRIQGLRKDRDLGYTERIALYVDGDPAVVAALDRYREHVASETLVREWDAEPRAELVEGEVDGLALRLGLRRLG